MRFTNLAACAAVVFTAHSYAAAPNMKEGLWEITTKMEMPGMPAGMPPQTIKQCVTKMSMKQGGQTHNMTMHYTGKHLGECKP